MHNAHGYITITVEPSEEVAQAVTKDNSRLRAIRTSPRRVRLTDIETGAPAEFQSLYAAGKALGHSSKIINDYNNRVYKGKYQVVILTESTLNTSANLDSDGRPNVQNETNGEV